MHRWVNRGSKGIALLDDSGSYLKLKYVFDFSDTHPGYQGLIPFIWKIETGFQEPVLSHLEDTYSFEARPSSLPDALLELGKTAAAENYSDYLDDFRCSVPGSFLSGLDDLNLELLFRRTLTVSVQYTLLKRCGFDPEDYLSQEEFADIHSFNTVDSYFNYLSKQTQKTGKTIHFSVQFCLCFHNPLANVFNSAAISGFANSFIKSS